MAKGAKSLLYKDMLNQLEEEQPGAKHRFLVGYLKQGRKAVEGALPVELRECASCGQPTTAEVCSYCRMVERNARRLLPVIAAESSPAASTPP